MGSLSSMPRVPSMAYTTVEITPYTSKAAQPVHHNLEECRVAVEHLSKLGTLSLNKEGARYNLRLRLGFFKTVRASSTSLCGALKELLRIVDKP